VFRYTSWRFCMISGTNRLIRCHSASSLFSAVFVFQKCYTGKYSRNWTKQVPEVLFFPEEDRRPNESRRAARGCPHHEGAWPRPWPHPPMVRPPWSPPDDAPSPISSLPTENPETISNFPERVPQLRRRR
jgi:hypothetical protein